MKEQSTVMYMASHLMLVLWTCPMFLFFYGSLSDLHNTSEIQFKHVTRFLVCPGTASQL